MKKLTKGIEPQILKDNGATWTEEFRVDSSKRRWANKDIKAALSKETGSKCAYCEGQILATGYEEVEHILPKNRFPELVLSWSNLTIVCSRCNSQKGAKYDPQLLFVNPYVDDIHLHLYYTGPLVFHVSDRGMYSVNELNLNETARVEARNSRIKSLESLLRRYEEASNEYVKTDLAALIAEFVSSGEYSAALLSYIAGRKKDLPNKAEALAQFQVAV